MQSREVQGGVRGKWKGISPSNIALDEVKLGNVIACPHAATGMVSLLPLHQNCLVVNPLIFGNIQQAYLLRYRIISRKEDESQLPFRNASVRLTLH